MLQKVLSILLAIWITTGCIAQEIPSQANNRIEENQAAPGSLVAGQVAPLLNADPAAEVKEQPAVVENQPQADRDQPAASEVQGTENDLPAQEPAVQAPAEEQNTGADLQTTQQGINPLTGLVVEDAQTLALAPALVSITNFPVTARPQAGLSFSPFVFEMYIGEGMTRFLALFYGDYPEQGENQALALSDDRVGPVRSGRLPYEDLRKLYSGFLVMSSASSLVTPSLSQYTNVFGSDSDDINSALVPATRLKEIAEKQPKRLKTDALGGLSFSETAPQGGKTAHSLWIPFNYLNQVIWRYDEASGAYHRYQDMADGQTFVQATDRLTDEPLTYENVVVLFANHQAKKETLITIDLLYINRMPALVFRDGKMYEIFWTTANGDYEKKTGLVRPIRFIDAQGNPFALKPGQTWVEIVQAYTPYNETIESEVYFDLKKKTSPGSGHWAVKFFPTIPEE